MPKIDVYKTDGTKSGQLNLNDDIFGVEVNESAMHQVVVAHLANKRQGTQSALTRAEVRGGGIKPYRQKGTGRARAGTATSPIWRKGGVVFAPKPRDYSKDINKKMKRLALKSALSAKVNDKNIICLDDIKMDAPKTKDFIKIMENLKVEGKALVCTEEKIENVVKSARNIAGVTPTFAGVLSTYDVLNHEKLIVTKAAVKKIEEVLS
ncbi:MAG: 50S ribosomal protein L4 [Eubacteriales bacterium]